MNSINMNPKAIEEVNKRVLNLEKESLANINQYDDSQMVNKIIKIFEEVKIEYENK